MGSKVITQSGSYLGKVIDFDINTESRDVVRFYVRGDLLERLKQITIEARQVMKIREGEIVVQDAVITEKTVPQVEPEYGSSSA